MRIPSPLSARDGEHPHLYPGIWSWSSLGKFGTRYHIARPAIYQQWHPSYLGHHDPAFTLRVYAHLVPDAADRMRAVIDRAARGEADGPVTAPGMVR
jgi:hypothetical protein